MARPGKVIIGINIYGAGEHGCFIRSAGYQFVGSNGTNTTITVDCFIITVGTGIVKPV